MYPLRLFISLIVMHCFTTLSAQEFSGGFRAGLNFESFDSDAEMDPSGMTLETFKRTTGFHVGATFALAFTDLVGLKADLMYSQKGGEILYEGPSYFYLYGDGLETRALGNRRSETDVVNSYIDIPLVGYYRIGIFEVEGGLSGGFLVNSRASGSSIVTNVFSQTDGRQLPDLSVSYDYNYFSNVTGEAALIEATGSDRLPEVIDAYYNSNDDRPLYRRLDFGLVGGVAVFLNNGLYLGLRYQYGLTDATRGENDQQFYADDTTTEREYNTDDKDYNRVIQASVGFRF